MPKFNVLLADPPWAYTNKRTGGSHTSGSAQQYPVIDTETLCKLSGLAAVAEGLVARHAVCFLWATAPMLPDAIEVLDAWGFDYKTFIVWHKTERYGTGYWFRGEVELLLFGTRGNVPAFRSGQRNWVDVVEHPVLGHSEKPEIFREIIEAATQRTMVDRRALELFARRPAPYWVGTGLELDGRDVLKMGWWRDLPEAETMPSGRLLSTIFDEEQPPRVE